MTPTNGIYLTNSDGTNVVCLRSLVQMVNVLHLSTFLASLKCAKTLYNGLTFKHQRVAAAMQGAAQLHWEGFKVKCPAQRHNGIVVQAETGIEPPTLRSWDNTFAVGAS